MYLEVSEMSDPDKLNFTYSSGDFSQDKLGFQLEFENPGHVSETIERDMLVILLNKFRDDEQKLIAVNEKIRVSVPN